MKQMGSVVSIEVIIEEYMNGNKIPDIAKRYGVSRQAVWQRLKRHKIVCSTRRSKPKTCACGKQFRGEKKHCSRECTALSRKKPLKTHCKRGHPLVEGNLYPRYSNTPPRCKACAKIRMRDWQRKKREKAKNK